MTEQQVVKALVKNTLKACNEFAGYEQYADYAVNIRRKAAALRKNPTAKAAYDVLSDLKTISQMVGAWEG